MKTVAGNWKMNKSKAEAESFFREASQFKAPKGTRSIVAPSPTLLPFCLEAAKGGFVEVFSQNCHWENSGAFTGETSPTQLVDLGVKGTLIGHSERRQYFGESNESCVQRTRAARKNELEVIFCIGESQKQRENNETEQILGQQLTQLCEEFSGDKKIILAYEPVWAIGTGLTASVEQVRETHAWIFEFTSSRNCHWDILYGGSVKPNNFKDLAATPHVAGGLVGGASLEAQSFQALLNCLTELSE